MAAFLFIKVLRAELATKQTQNRTMEESTKDYIKKPGEIT